MGNIRMRPVSERFFEKVMPVPESGCWLWIASTNKRGYGQFMMLDRRPHLAHRVSWRLEKGEIPIGLHVLHKCDTPACVNPDHLFLGTDRDNVQDMLRKGRENRTPRRVGAAHGMAKITSEVALAIFNAEGAQTRIALQFGVPKSTVNHIKSGRQWSTVTGLPKKEKVSSRLS
jgi:hypothetical protein